MLRSFFTTAFRNLCKNRVYTSINVLGLALGIACCLVIFVIVKYETSFDDYHGKADRIYRVNLNQQTPHGRRLDGCNYTPLAEAIRKDVSGLEAVTGVYCLREYQFSKNDNLFEETYAFFADHEYFEVFDADWITGNLNMALTMPNTAVVTDSFAETFLGGVNNALGSTFLVENRLTLTVTGIVKAPPSNTDHPYSILISYASLPAFFPESVDNWETVASGATYVVFSDHTRESQIYPQLDKIISRHLEEEIAKNTRFHLMRLKDNHDRNYDYSSFNYDFPVPVMIILSIIAAMIAFIACINFVNLATAQSLKRAREVGLRKTMGSTRSQLIMQYMSEAFIITLLAVIVGMILAKAGMMELNAQYGGNYLRFNLLNDPSTIAFLIAMTLVITFLAGLYPAFILSGYKPVLALKAHTFTGKGRRLSLRRILVVSQFAGAQVLILVTVIMINQIKLFQDRPFSYDPETIVLISSLRGNDSQQHARLHHELDKVPGIINHTFGNVGNERVEFYANEAEKFNGIASYIDTSYIHTFGFELLAGRNLSEENPNVSSEVLVNETLTKGLGIASPEEAIGRIYTIKDREVVIRGVLKDSYNRPMSNEVDAATFHYDPNRFAAIAINISTERVPETLSRIEGAWKSVYPEYILKYEFMDDALERQYGFFDIIFSFFGIASFLAIFIGCLGLYGLISFMAIQRTKEVGIRKVCGASVSSIMMLFGKESAMLVLFAFAFAAPIAHLAGAGMLMEFPERVNPGIEMFLLTFMGSLVIACGTVAYRSFTAAVQDPVESLRTDG